MAAIRYRLSHVRGDGGRCVWCWVHIDDTDTHTVVEPVGGATFDGRPLRFHHRCWEAYRTMSGADLKAVGVSVQWDAARLEKLRMHCALDVEAFCRSLKIGTETYALMMAGRRPLSPAVLRLARQLAVRDGFEAGGGPDWSDPAAVLSLRMHLGWEMWQMANALGAADPKSIRQWERHGLPRRSVRTWGRCNRLAEEHGFDRGMVVPFRAWTRASLEATMAASGKTAQEWAAVAGLHGSSVRNVLCRERNVTAEMQWRLTAAAARLGIAPPPVVKKQRPKGPRGWPDEWLLLLGTVPDQEVADRTGKLVSAVRAMRLHLGIPTVPGKGWDGTPRPAPVPLDEIKRRFAAWRAARRDENARRQTE